MPETPPKVPLRDIFRVFFTIGASSFGGGVTGWMHRITVGQRGWLTNEKFLAGLALGQVLPGAMLATLIGWKIAGWAGALVATLALFGPASILTLLVARVYDRYRGRDWHTALEAGLAPVAVGLIFAGAISIIRLSGNGLLTWAAAVGAGLVLTLRPKLHPFLVLFAGAALFVIGWFTGRRA